MDTFIEQIIKKRFSALDYLIIAGELLAGLVLLLSCWVFMPVLFSIIFVAVCVAEYYLLTSRNLEYEYSVTNGDITIDKITNKRSRKRLITMDAHDIESMGKFKPEDHAQKSYDFKLVASENGFSDKSWYFFGHHTKKGNVLVVFDPNDTVLASIKPFLKRQVSVDAFGRN